MAARPIGIGIIGTGFGLRALLPAFERTGCARVVALSGSSAERAEKLGNPYGIPFVTGDHRAVCEARDVDLVVVASPNDLHLEHVDTALATGKHVYIEKPVGLNAEEARQIEALVGDHGRLVVVGHSLRLDPCVRALRDLVAAGAIGRVYHAAIVQCGSSHAPERRPPDWQRQAERGGGVRLGMGSHMFDVLRFLVGSDALAVTAAAAPTDDVADTYFSAIATYPELTVHLVTTAAAHVPARFDILLHGERGDLTLSINRTLLLHRVGREPEAPVHEHAAASRGTAIFDVALTYLAEAVVDALMEGRTTVDGAATPADAVRCMKELDAALTSIRSGSTVRLEHPVPMAAS